MPQRVFVDANILFSRTLRDWLFLLRLESQGGLFQIHTTWDVITETGARLRDKYPEANGRLVSGLIEKCQEIFDEILSDYPGGKVGDIQDREDWHVHYAANACNAQILLTEDAGFTSEDTFYEAYTCDEFFMEINTSSPKTVQNVTKTQVMYWGRKKSKPLQMALIEAGCPRFAQEIQAHIRHLAL